MRVRAHPHPPPRRFSSLAAASTAGSRSPLEQVRGGGEFLAQGHQAWGRDRDPLGSDCYQVKVRLSGSGEGDGNHALCEQAWTHWSGRARLCVGG